MRLCACNAVLGAGSNGWCLVCGVDLRRLDSDTCAGCGGGRLVDDPNLTPLIGTVMDDGEVLTAGQCWMPCPTCGGPDA